MALLPPNCKFTSLSKTHCQSLIYNFISHLLKINLSILFTKQFANSFHSHFHNSYISITIPSNTLASWLALIVQLLSCDVTTLKCQKYFFPYSIFSCYNRISCSTLINIIVWSNKKLSLQLNSLVNNSIFHTFCPTTNARTLLLSNWPSLHHKNTWFLTFDYIIFRF
jgi:hypothetical protein